MSIDSVDPPDTTRDDSRRVDEKKAEKRREQARLKTGQDFAACYQSNLQARTKEKNKLDVKKEGEADRHSSDDAHKEANIFSRVIEAFRGREQKQGDQKESRKKEETKKEETGKEGEESLHKTRVQDGHQRIDSTHARHQDGGGGAGSERQGGGFGGGSQQSTGGGQGSFSGSDKGQQSATGGRYGNLGSGSVKAGALREEGKDSSSSGQGRFSNKILDEIVVSVDLHLNAQGETAMEIHLADPFFAGLRLIAKKTVSGIVLVFRCPNREVRNSFLIHRPLIYNRLKEKNIKVDRIEIELA